MQFEHSDYQTTAELLQQSGVASEAKFQRRRDFQRQIIASARRKENEKKRDENKNKSVRKQQTVKTGKFSKMDTILEEQFGVQDVVNSFFVTPESSDVYASHLENICAMFIALRDCTTWKQTFSIAVLYFKTFSNKSISLHIMDIVSECIFGCTYKEQSGREDEDAFPLWIEAVKCITTNWKKVVNSSFFRNIAKLLSVSCALGLCTISRIPFGAHALKVFPEALEERYRSVPDLLSACGETLCYFVEGGYRCLQSGSLLPFTMGDNDAEIFEQEYFDIMDLAPLMRAGNMERVKGVTENDFDYRITKLIEKCDNFYKVAIGSYEKKVLYEKLLNLRRIRTDFLTIRADGGLRVRPFSYYVVGPSGVGKSTISAVLMRVILLANGFEASDDRIVNLNEADAYLSNYRSYVNGVYCDDLGNTQAQYLDKSPLTKLIELVNNVKAYAVMAELELKGKVTMEPKCVGATSNVHIAGLASQFSNEPFSIVSRFNVQVEAKVKKQFAFADGRLDQSKVFDLHPEGVPLVPDLWDLKVFKPNCTSGNHMREEISGVSSLPELIKYVVSHSKKHFSHQTKFIEVSRDLDERLAMCSECYLPQQLCTCRLDQQFGVQDVISAVPQMVPSVWVQRLYGFFQNTYGRVPLLHVSLQQLYTYYMTATLVYHWKLHVSCVVCAIVLHYLLLLYMFCPMIGLYIVLIFIIAGFVCKTVVERHIQQNLNVRGFLVQTYATTKAKIVANFALYSTVVFSAYTLYLMYRRTTGAIEKLESQGSLDPKSLDEVIERDAQENPWKQMGITPLPKNDKTSSMTSEELCNVVSRNVVYVQVIVNGKKHFTVGLFVRSNILLLPLHFVKYSGSDFILEIIRKEGSNGVSFRTHISSDYTISDAERDCAVCYVFNSPNFRDIVQYFQNSTYRDCESFLLHRTSAGISKRLATYAHKGNVTTDKLSFPGYHYVLQEPTFKGLCGAPLVSRSSQNVILGIHLGGKQYSGGAVSLNQTMISDMVERLCAIPGVIKLVSEGVLLTNQYGVEFFESTELHPKSPCNYLSEGAHADVFGSVIGRSTNVSKVEATVISQSVTRVCGVENKWGPPKFAPQRWRPWQESLDVTVRPAIGFPGRLLKRAVEDYVAPLITKLEEFEYFPARPLTRDETVCGIPGVRFIDAIKSNTAVGYPLVGPKDQFMVVHDDPFSVYQDYKTLDNKFWKEFDNMEKNYLDDKRHYPIFKASLKDEPTKLTKDKVRVFQAAPLVLQLGVRMYFLPIARFLSLFPLLTECAVGVNAHGPEWHTLSTHMMKFGKRRIFAGDYSKFDLRLPMQITLAAFDILLTLASKMKYSSRDLQVMRGLISDLVAPMVAYNGDLVMFFGSNPSGQNLTVYINCVGNSLILRCAFFGIYESLWFSRDTNFRNNVALMTYGDDVKGSVKDSHGFFNHVSVANWLKEHDILFTMPDKESKPKPFMDDDEADFLKRRNFYNKDIGSYVGLLDEMSIFKSLHSVLKSKSVTNREQCISNISGALREWFFYGKETYYKRQKEMATVADEHGLVVPMLAISYDELLQEHKSKYYAQNLSLSQGVLVEQ